MALGDAYVNVRANTSGFAADLQAQIDRIVRSANAAATAAARTSQSASASAAKAAQDAARAQEKANAEALADWRRTAREIEKAEAEAYAQVAADARRAAQEQAAAARDAAAAQKAAAREAVAANALAAVESGGILDDFANKIRSKFEYAVIKSFRRVAEGVGIIDVAIGAFGIKASADLEQVQVAFENLFDGNKARADAFLKQLRDLANTTAFSFTDVAGLAQQFKALELSTGAKLSSGNILEILNSLAGAGARAGVGLDKVKLAGVALAQIASSARVSAQDLRQLQNALNIPQSAVFRQLAIDLGRVQANADPKKIAAAGAALKELHDAGKIEISGTAGLKAAVETLQAGGKSAQALAAQSKTLKVELSNVADVLRNKLAVAFDPVRKKLETLFSPEAIGGNFDKSINRISDSVGKLTLQVITGLVNNLPTIISFINAVNVGFEATFTALGKVVDFIKNLQPTFERLKPVAADVFASIKDIGTVIGDVAGPLGSILAPSVAAVALAVRGIRDSLDALTQGTAGAVIEGLTLSIGLLAGALFLANARAVVFAIELAGVVLEAGILTSAMYAAATAVAALDAAIAANPIGAAILAVAALAAEVIYAYQQFETFRRVVAAVMNAITRSVAFAVKLVISAFLVLVESVVQAAADTFGWVPGIGPKLKAAAAHVHQFALDTNAAIDSIRKDLTVTVTVNANTRPAIDSLNGLARQLNLKNNVFSQAALKQLNENNAEGFAADAASITADLNKQGFFEPLPPDNNDNNDNNNNTTKTTKSAAETFRDRISAILKKLDADFRNTLINGTGKAITSAIRGIESAITTAFKGKNTLVDDKLNVFLEKSNVKLRKLADERDALIKRLADATNKAHEVARAAVDFANITSLDFTAAANATADAVKKINTEVLDVAGSFEVTSRTIKDSSTSASDAVTHSADQFAAALQARLDAIKNFQAEIDILIAKGLNKETIDQIISAGVAGGGATAQALAGASAQTIETINKTQAAIDKAATDLGNTAADSLFRAGTNVVDGLIAGLKSRKGEIADAMTDIAKTLIDRIRKDLKIHSPSRVMRDLFRHAGAGAVLGLDDTVAHVGAAASRVAKASLPTLAPVDLGTLQSAGAAQALSSLRQGGAAGGALDTDAIVAAIQTARASKEIHAPVTQHFHGSQVDEAGAMRAVNTALGRAVRR